MWLVSVPTAVGLVGAGVGALLALWLVDVDPFVAFVGGAVLGWLVFAVLLGGWAERADRRLHRMGASGRRRRG